MACKIVISDHDRRSGKASSSEHDTIWQVAKGLEADMVVLEPQTCVYISTLHNFVSQVCILCQGEGGLKVNKDLKTKGCK